jgi:hypothetical protein
MPLRIVAEVNLRAVTPSLFAAAVKGSSVIHLILKKAPFWILLSLLTMVFVSIIFTSFYYLIAFY